MVGATGTGKTWYGPIDTWERLKEKPGSDFLVVGRNRMHHIELLISYFEDWFKAIDVEIVINRSIPRITIPSLNDAKIFFGSDEAPESMEGHHYTAGAWIDEAALMSWKTWRIVQRRVGLLNLPILVTTIPYQSGFVQKEIYDVWRLGQEGHEDIEYVQLNYEDNPRYDRAEIERQRRRLPAHEFDRIYLGVWSKPAGMIFYPPDDPELLLTEWPVPDDYKMREIAPGLEVPYDWPLYSGHDYGYTAPTAGVWAVRSPDDVLVIVATYEKEQLTIPDHVRTWTRYGLNKTLASFGDPANPGQWQEASDLGMQIDSHIGEKKLENDIVYGIGLVQTRLKTGRLKVLQGGASELWLKRREAYIWTPDPKTAGETQLEKPLPNESEHLMDATRYLVVGLHQWGHPNEPLVMTSGRQIHQ